MLQAEDVANHHKAMCCGSRLCSTCELADQCHDLGLLAKMLELALLSVNPNPDLGDGQQSLHLNLEVPATLGVDQDSCDAVEHCRIKHKAIGKDGVTHSADFLADACLCMSRSKKGATDTRCVVLSNLCVMVLPTILSTGASTSTAEHLEEWGREKKNEVGEREKGKESRGRA